MQHRVGLSVAIPVLGILGLLAPAMHAHAQVGRDMGCSPTLANPCTGSPAPGRGNAQPYIDYGAIEAQRRQAEAAEAERKRQLREDEERQAEARRRREQAERDAAFIRERDTAARALRGSAGVQSPGGGELRGGTGGLPQLRSAAPAVPATPAAWRSLHCVAVILGPALAAAGKDAAEFNFLAGEAEKALAGQPVGVDCGKTPSAPDLDDAALARLRDTLRRVLDRARAVRDNAKAGAELDRYAAASRALEGGDARPMLALRVGAVPATAEARAAEKKRLAAQDKELATRIERDITAIRRLGFARRAEDFAEWEQLSRDAKAQFEKEIIDIATDKVAGKVSDRLLEGFKKFDSATAARWVASLGKVEPRPVELIGLINKVAGAADKAQMAKEAALILQGIERIQSAQAAKSGDDLMLLGLDLMCDVVPPPGDANCNAFKAAGKFTAASLYNNAARRVAANEVERLTKMTEAQLKALAKLNEVMAGHVKERSEVRAKLKELD